MRKLMWFAIGFTAACAVGAYLFAGIWLALVSIIAALPLFFLNTGKVRVAAVILLGLSAGSVWFWCYNAIHLQPVRQYDGETIEATVTASDYSFETDYGVAVDGDIVLNHKTFRVRAYLREGESLSPGDVISGSLRLRATTPDSLQGATYHQGEGIFLLAYVSEEATVDYTEDVPIRYYASVLRNSITSILDKLFPEDVRGFVRALLLGDSSLLTYEEDTAFKLSGIRHVVAVSGLHVSILFSLVCLLSSRRRVSTALIGIPVLFLFAAVAGFTPSVVRACIMQGLMILALLFNKEYDPPTALSFAVLVMLCVNPMTITSVSFQLSAGCLVGIFLFYRRINGYLCKRVGAQKGMSFKMRLLRWLCGSVSVTLSAMITTTPLSAWYFGNVSLAGILTNLLTLWVISFIFYGIMLACLLSLVWPGAGMVVANVVAWPVRYVLLAAKVMSGSVLSAVYSCSIYIVIWLVMCYVLFAVFLLSKRRRAGYLALCVVTGLIAAVALSWTEPHLDNYRVTVLDVGQGQSILLQCDGRNYLVDCGGDSETIAADAVSELLLSQGITKLDGLILTHYDKDHAGGVEPLLTRIGADVLYLPNIADESGVRGMLEQNYGQQILWVNQHSQLSWGTTSISLVPATERDKGNESCLSVLFQTENCDILITGDLGFSGEQALIDNADLPKLELLVVGHHGSADATGLPLLYATKPAAAVISVGKNNFHGHPAENALYRLRLFGCRIWRTDLDGTILFRG